MSGDIEEFLRRAAQRRQAQAQAQSRAQGGQTARPAPPKPQRPQRTAMPVQPLPEVIDADIVEAEPVSGDDVAAYVNQHLSTRDFTERAQHLGEDTRRSEASLEHEVERHFQKPRRTGRHNETLVSQVSAPAAVSTAAIEPARVGNELIAMFRTPENIRLAFILGEVFTRPEHRWEE